MTCKVRRDFRIITDVISRVSLVTSNVRGSSICSPKSLYKKTSNEFLAELKAVVKTGSLKVPETRPVLPQSAATNLLWQACVNQPALTHTPRHHREEGRRRNFLSCSDHSWIKTTAIFFPLHSSLSISFSANFFLYSTKRWSYGTGIGAVKWLLWKEMETATRVQILDETDCIFHRTNTQKKRESNYSPSKNRLGSLALVRQPI